MSSSTHFEQLFAAQVRKINEKHTRSQMGLPQHNVSAYQMALIAQAEQAAEQRMQRMRMVRDYQVAPTARFVQQQKKMVVVKVKEEVEGPYYDGPNIFLYNRHHYPEVEHPETAREAAREQYDQMRRTGSWSREEIKGIDARIRMAHLGFLNEIDLHGMSVEGAVGLVTEALDAVKEVLKRSGGLTYKVDIITGYGSHSRNRHSEIQARVTELLQSRGIFYRIDKRRKGLLEATFNAILN